MRFPAPVVRPFEMRDNTGQDQPGGTMDWNGCDIVETVPGKMGGRPIIKGTRIEPETVLIDEEYGRTPEQTQASFPTLSVDTILRIRAFAHRHQLTP
jgi:uncharacterized protein (DUF433 family)